MKKITSIYLWLLLLVLSFILFFLLISLAKRKMATTRFEQNFVEFKRNDKYASLIDSSFYQLLKIENNLQLFAITKREDYYGHYLRSLDKMNIWIDSLDNYLNDQNQINNGLDSLMRQKINRMRVFISLKTLNDSLINYADKLQEAVNVYEVRPKLSPAEIKQLESVYVTSTTNIIPVKTNKKLLGRIKDAIYNRELDFDTLKNSDIKANIDSDEAWANRAKQAENIKKYNLVLNSVLDRLVDNHKKLQAQQIDLFINNNQLLSKLKETVKTLKSLDTERYNTEKLKNETKKSLDIIDKFYENVLLISVILVLIILLNIWSLYKNEKKLKKAKEVAIRQTKIKTDFLAHMSHEIRTPLNSILGFSEQLEKSDLSGEQRKQLVSVQSASQILLSIVNDILDLSKLETGKLNIQSFPFFPRKTIEDIVSTLKIHADKKHLDLLVNYHFDQHIQLNGDEYRLKQVVINLVTNAIKFTKSGSVTINAAINEHCVMRIEVVDTGIGIDKENLKMVFDEFTQILNKSDNNRHNGTGLGLAICKKIIQSQRGFIEVESEIGKGSKFFFEIPYSNCKEVVQTKETESKITKIINPMENNQLLDKRILVADDNLMNIMLLKAIFKKWGVTFDEARDGLEALELFKVREYDILLTDIQMPNLDGVELAKEIRSYPEKEKAKMPIVAITANSMEDNVFIFKKAGIDGCLVKPFKEETLYSKILEHLN
ncbi:integral membrane sensor hybrid histidine kinase [Pseudopedobacter saltans DSM 12145]|uniref:histidine kinase n=1 Tax=Pseudopedobacter saltans (strain ATCC 51119 / DSM 12145 / JCM 21818 / CCUG 39354 / LMG 10337 / NBRC 100064 / NCIMB 13643) TaxID=762903 RepID=F0S9R4_PSESL|nr:ATP-binding protein [Pseudopedobacter saltans]ADY51420.1 integral membrane sensor hybrid histidine kinase [Pseudopedobacter saltans DSM 12145]